MKRSAGFARSTARVRAIAIAIAFAFALAHALAAQAVNAQDANAPTVRAQDTPGTPDVYSSMGDDGVCAATKDAWYFEEYDDRSRPISGVLWKSGTIAERTSWAYRGDGQQATMKIATNAESSTTSEYDEAGRALKVKVLDPKGTVVESIENEYDKEGNLVLTVSAKGDVIVRTEITYDKGEQKTKRVFRNGEPTMTWQSTGKNDWTETMYRDGEAVLVVEYADGVRKARP